MPTFKVDSEGRFVSTVEPRCQKCGGRGMVLQRNDFRSRYNGVPMSSWSWVTCGECKGFGFLPSKKGGR
jgi:DnaJ-class molecular chaperone